jgi:hypothetical protein
MRKLIFILTSMVSFSASAQVSGSGCYISGALIDPASTAGCGNGGSNYCDLASLYVPAFSPTACGTSVVSGGTTYNHSTSYSLPAGCTATVIAEYKKRNYLGVGSTSTGCSNSGMDGSPDGLSITSSGGTLVSQNSTFIVNVGTCATYPALGTYTTAVSTVSPGCSNGDATVQRVVTGGSFTIMGTSNRADEIITFTVNFSGTCGASCSSVLPVELITFYAEALPGKVDLTWKVGAEINLDHYLIEKSADAMNWIEVAKIQPYAAGESHLVYKTSDHYPSRGVNYYRLISVDEDGTQGQFKILAVNYDEDSNVMWMEQTDDYLVPHLNSKLTYETILLLDNSGRTIFQTGNVISGQQVSIPKKQLAKGLYFLSTISSGGNKSYKVILN